MDEEGVISATSNKQKQSKMLRGELITRMKSRVGRIQGRLNAVLNEEDERQVPMFAI